MHLSLTTLEIESDCVESARRVWEETVAPTFRRAPGFLDVLFCVGARVRSKGLIVGLWEDEASARDFELSGRFERAIEPLEGFMRSRPVRTVHEVVARTEMPRGLPSVLGYRPSSSS
jgi:heme-degrading monooxygenase HmoA